MENPPTGPHVGTLRALLNDGLSPDEALQDYNTYTDEEDSPIIMVTHDVITHDTEVPVVPPPFEPPPTLEPIIVTTVLLDEYEHNEAMFTGIPYFYDSRPTRTTPPGPNPPTFYA